MSVSVGALADASLMDELVQAAEQGASRLLLASEAVGALDALSAASVGRLDEVTYVGREPLIGWRGSPAEEQLDLDSLTAPAIHFEGSDRDCVLRYPKNANVAASVALAGLGFDKTRARLIADPGISQNLHEISAKGDFGSLAFTIAGNGMPDTPKSSALTAMSVVRAITRQSARIGLT